LWILIIHDFPFVMEQRKSLVNERLLDVPNYQVKTSRFYFSAAGIGCAIICRDAELQNHLAHSCRLFESKGQSEFEIIVQLQPRDVFFHQTDNTSPYPVVERMGRGNNFIIKGTLQLPYIAFANTATRKMLVKIANLDCFDNVLRILFTLVLAEKGGLVLDALTVNEEGNSNIFVNMVPDNQNENPGPMGDPIIIKPHNHLFRIYPITFRDEQMERGTRERAQLRGLYLMKQHERTELISLEKTQAAMELFRCSSWFTTDRLMLNRILKTCFNIVGGVPTYELHFRQDPFESPLLKELDIPKKIYFVHHDRN
jgi:hypothetical protein